MAKEEGMSEEEFIELVEEGDLASVKDALRRGADPDSEDDDNRTALVIAASAGDLDKIEALVAAGASLGCLTARDAAKKKGYLHVVAFLESKFDGK